MFFHEWSKVIYKTLVIIILNLDQEIKKAATPQLKKVISDYKSRKLEPLKVKLLLTEAINVNLKTWYSLVSLCSLK